MRFFKRALRLFAKLSELFITDEEYARKMGVKIGRGCYISTRFFPSEPYLVEIGNYVRIAPYTKLFTHGGLWSQRKKHPELSLEHFGKISIGDYTYIGEQCMIMAGVSIGSNVIVGASSIVTKSIPDGVIVAGNPAKIVGNTEDLIKRVDAMKVVKSKDFYYLSPQEREKYILNLDESQYIKKGLMKNDK